MDCPFPVPPGGDAERSLLSALLEELDYHDLMYMLQPVHVIVPEYNSVTVITGSKQSSAVPLLPSPSFSGTVVNYVVAGMPRSPLELKSIYEGAVKSGADLLVMRGPGFGFISQGPGLSLQGNDYPPIPAIVVGDDVELGDKPRIEINIEGNLHERLAYNLVVEKQGDSEESVVFLTHMDSWKWTMDACPSLNAMVKLVKFVSSRSPRKSFKFVFATARHFGDPALPSMYWGVGHRRYLHRFGDAVLAVDFEAATSLAVAASEETHGLLAAVSSYFPFTAAVHSDMMGIPTIHVEGGLDILGMLESVMESMDAMDNAADRLTERYVAAVSPSLSRFGIGNLINRINKDNLPAVRRLLTRYLVIDEREVARPLSMLDFLASTGPAEISEVGTGFRLMGRRSPSSLRRTLMDDLIEEIRSILTKGE